MAAVPPSRAFTMESHQKYMKEHVNPMLESLVTALLLKKPVDPVPFMVSWFAEQVPNAAGTTPGVDDGGTSHSQTLEQLRKAVAETKGKCRNLEEKVVDEFENKNKDMSNDEKKKIAQDAMAQQKQDNEEEEEEEEDDDEDVMDMEEYEKKQAEMAAKHKGPRTSVSAEAYGAWNKKDVNFTAPKYPKSPDEVAALKDVLQKIFMFSSLQKEHIDTVVGAMQLHPAAAGDKVIEEGDEGNFLYVVEVGALDCFKKIDGESKKVKEYNPAEAFGELALLYNCPRAATVIARDAARLWKLDRETFNHIVKGASQKRMQNLEDFVKRCAVLRGMDMFERTKLCEALRPESYKKGDTIVSEGEIGTCMYFIEKGACVAQKVLEAGHAPVDVMKHEEGDYFGELALMQGEPRAATVLAASDCTLMVMDRNTFNGLIGSMRDVLRRSYAPKNES